MAFDYKKEYRDLYMPGRKPALVDVPPMRFIVAEGTGDPNVRGGDYQRALGALYAVAYTIKMSKLTERRIEGYFDYVVPPLEGFWRFPGGVFAPARKSEFHWISAIRLPDFAAEADVAWALDEARRKGKLDYSVASRRIDEGLCVQLTHVGAYDDEPASIRCLTAYIADSGLAPDLSEERPHHEIYLSDPRRTAPEKLKTVIRLPVRRL